MPKLNKTQKYAVCWLNNKGKTNIEISNELDISVKQVDDTIAKNSKESDNNVPVDTKPVFKKPQIKDMMITTTSGKRRGGIAIMTQQASEAADALRNKAPAKIINKNTHRINKDK